MAFLSRGVLTDYDPDEGMFHVTDVQRPAIAGATPNVERVYDLVQAFQAEGPGEITRRLEAYEVETRPLAPWEADEA